MNSRPVDGRSSRDIVSPQRHEQQEVSFEDNFVKYPNARESRKFHFGLGYESL
jgi:hypothetical protein